MAKDESGRQHASSASTEALIKSEDAFALRLGRRLARVEGAPARLRLLLEECSHDYDVSLWLTLWSRARDDADADVARRRVEDQWRELIASLIAAGQAEGEFSSRINAREAALMLAAVIDGLAIQATVGDPGVSPERMLDISVLCAESILATRLPPLT
jgi:hypothetical protein